MNFIPMSKYDFYFHLRDNDWKIDDIFICFTLFTELEEIGIKWKSGGEIWCNIEDVDSIKLAEKYNYNYFTEFMAEEIFKFLKDHQHAKNCFVICDAGISRSVGAACALNEIFNNDQSMTDRSPLRNQLVYSTLLKCWNGEKSCVI